MRLRRSEKQIHFRQIPTGPVALRYAACYDVRLTICVLGISKGAMGHGVPYSVTLHFLLLRRIHIYPYSLSRIVYIPEAIHA